MDWSFQTDPDGEDQREPEALPEATHLDSPITAKNQRLATKTVPEHHSKIGQRAVLRERAALEEALGSKLTHLNTRWSPSQLLRKLLRSTPQNYATSRERGKLFWQVATENVALQHTILSEIAPGEPSVPEVISQIGIPDHLLTLYTAREIWEGLVRISSKPLDQRSTTEPLMIPFDLSHLGVAIYQMGEFKIYVGKRLWVIKHAQDIYLLNREQLLMISDLVSQRFVLKMVAHTAEALGKKEYLRESQLDFLLDWGDKILEMMGEEGYAIVYKLEAICLSVLIGQLPGVALGLSFIDKLRKELAQSYPQQFPTLIAPLFSFLETLNASNPHLVSQSYGLFRLWGHPIIDALEGVIALKQLATSYRCPDRGKINAINATFLQTFCHRYWRDNHKWPSLDVTQLPAYHPIRDCYEHNLEPPQYTDIGRRKHWNRVRTEKTFPIDPKFDLVEMIADKALSHTEPRLVNSIIREYGIGKSYLRSVIVQWLCSDFVDPEAFLRWIDRNGFPLGETVTGVCPKEREGKRLARLFGLLTLAKRMYVVLTEALLAEHLLRYFPEITMGDSATEITDKQIHMTTKKGSSTGVVYMTSLDFQKWNSNMRKEETKGLFNMIDGLFGLINCFTRTHEMFDGGVMYLADSFYLPPVKDNRIQEGLGSWKGHLGGIEGLRQKGWTIWTVSLILLATEGINGVFQIMGQGDNQIIKCSYPDRLSESQAWDEHQRLLKNIDGLLTTVGPPLKLEETWTSRDVYVYGKVIVKNGIPLTMSSKKIARVFRLANDDLPTIESALSSLAANASAACASDTDCVVPFLIYSMECAGAIFHGLTSTYLHRTPILDHLLKRFPHPVFLPSGVKGGRISYSPPSEKENKQLLLMRDKKLLSSLLIHPRLLGGFPIVLLGELIIRQFPDPLAHQISQLKIMHKHASPYLQLKIEAILSPSRAPTKEYQLLLENPYTLNIISPSAPSESKRREVLSFLEETISRPNSWIVNPAFRVFFSASQKDQSELCKELSEMRPFFVQVASLIYNATPTARANHVVGKLNKTNILTKLTMGTGRSVPHKVRVSEINQIAGILYNQWTFGTDLHWNHTLCSTMWANKLREETWGIRVEGLEAASPWEILSIYANSGKTICATDHLSERDKGYISVRVDTEEDDDRIESLRLGKFKPYCGSETKIKVEGYGKNVAKVNVPLVACPIKLQTIVGWGTEVDSNLAKIIRACLTSVTDLDPDLVRPLASEISGTVHHRIDGQRIDKGGVTGISYLHLTKVAYDSFPLVAYSKGTSNSSLFFQALYLAIGTCLSYLFTYSTDEIQANYHAHIKRSCCIVAINEEKLDLPTTKALQHIQPLPKGPLTWIPKEKITFPQFCTSVILPSESTDRQRTSAEISLEVAHLIAEHSIGIIKKFRDPGTSIQFLPGGGKMPVNWALKLDPELFLDALALRIIACVYATLHPDQSLTYSELESKTEMLIQSIHPRGFSHLDSWLVMPGVIDWLIQKNPLSKPPADSRASRSSLSSWFKGYITLLVREVLRTRDLPRMGVIYSSQSVSCDQHALLLIIVKDLLFTQDPSRLKNGLELYRAIKEYLIDLKDNHSQIGSTSLILRLATARANVLGYRIHKGIKPRIKTPGHSSIATVDGLIVNLSPYNYKKEELKFETSKLNVNETHACSILRLYRFGTQTTTLKYKNSPIDTTPGADFHSKLDMSLRDSPLPTSAIFKIASILAKSPVPIEKIECAACLGEGGGGFVLALLLAGVDRIFYNSLSDSEDNVEQSPPFIGIPSLVGRPDLFNRIIHWDVTCEGPMDLRSPAFVDYCETHISSRFSLVTCDAERVSMFPEKILQTTRNILRFCQIFQTQVLILKSFLREEILLESQVMIIGLLFKQVLILRSHFSSEANTEVYLLCTRRTNEDVDLKSLACRPLSISKVRDLTAVTLDYDKMSTISAIIKDSISRNVPYKGVLSCSEFNYLIEMKSTHRSVPVFLSNWLTKDILRVYRIASKRGKKVISPFALPAHELRRIASHIYVWWLLCKSCGGTPSNQTIQGFFLYQTQTKRFGFEISYSNSYTFKLDHAKYYNLHPLINKLQARTLHKVARQIILENPTVLSKFDVILIRKAKCTEKQWDIQRKYAARASDIRKLQLDLD